MIWHDYESVRLEFQLGAVTKESGDEEFGVLWTLEVTFALVGKYGDRIGALCLANGGHGTKAYPRG